MSFDYYYDYERGTRAIEGHASVISAHRWRREICANFANYCRRRITLESVCIHVWLCSVFGRDEVAMVVHIRMASVPCSCDLSKNDNNINEIMSTFAFCVRPDLPVHSAMVGFAYFFVLTRRREAAARRISDDEKWRKFGETWKFREDNGCCTNDVFLTSSDTCSLTAHLLTMEREREIDAHSSANYYGKRRRVGGIEQRASR